MPCQSDCMEPTPVEREAPLCKEVDRLTRENDLLREMVFDLDAGGKLTAANRRLVTQHQVAHRKEDLARLEKTLRQRIQIGDAWIENVHGKAFPLREAYERLEHVVTANPSQPLQPQLGFDPDSI